MDFGNAALLIATVFGVVELAKAILGGLGGLLSTNQAIRSRATAVLALVVGEGSVFLVAATVWAHEQVIGGHPLDKLNVASKVVVGLFVAGTAAFGDKALGALANVGTPMPQRPVAK